MSLKENLCVREVRVKRGSKLDDTVMHENYTGKREVSSEFCENVSCVKYAGKGGTVCM